MEQTKLRKTQYASSLMETSLDPAITISTDGKITDLNQAKENITGIKRKDLIGTDFFDYFTEPDKAREVYYTLFTNESVFNFPLTFRHISGKLTDVLFNGSVFKDEDGNVIGAVVMERDISEQKWAKELQIANQELIYQNNEKEKRAAELIIANEELAFQNNEKEKRAEELGIAIKELAFQNKEKENAPKS
jgi:PAS domain S-box-containing protein